MNLLSLEAFRNGEMNPGVGRSGRRLASPWLLFFFLHEARETERALRCNVGDELRSVRAVSCSVSTVSFIHPSLGQLGIDDIEGRGSVAMMIPYY